jgi:hypothetical protein
MNAALWLILMRGRQYSETDYPEDFICVASRYGATAAIEATGACPTMTATGSTPSMTTTGEPC